MFFLYIEIPTQMIHVRNCNLYYAAKVTMCSHLSRDVYQTTS